MAYVIGTTNRKIQWYRFTVERQNGHDQVKRELCDTLDLDRVSQFDSRAEARECYKQSGLTTCRYFKF